MENQRLSQIAGHKVLDWARCEAKAQTMTAPELHYAALDCAKAAEVGMSHDAGYYMDQCSVYRREQQRRAA